MIDRGEPRVLVMTAEAGIGKTRFAAEVERLAAGYDVGAGRYAAHTGARVLSVRCAAFGERRRLAPLADLVRAAVGLPSDAATAVTRPVVEERLRRLAQRLGPATGATPRRSPPTSCSPCSATPNCPPQRRTDAGRVGRPPHAARRTPRRCPNAVAELLSALAAEAPLVVVVDDLHDATAETVDALGRDPRTGSTGPVLVLLLGRPELVRTAGRADPGRRRRGARAARRCAAPTPPGCSPATSAAAGCRRPTPTGCSPPPRATRSTWPSWSPC